ncbi:MAG: glutamate 5-kinase [Gammaproteobacteria bacterium]
MSQRDISQREQLRHFRRWVVKIGSALLTDNGRGLDTAAIAGWVDQIAALRASGAQVVLVSSGAVAEGMVRLGMGARPDSMYELQACAAVGQMGLVQAWESQFARHGLRTAQVLLTHDDLADRRRYLNARSTLRTLLEFGVIPVVNENDTVVTDEIRFGDNDTLGALVTNLVEAEALIILTDQLGMFERDPRADPSAPLIGEARAFDDSLIAKATGSSASGLGRGGMATKIRAARLAARSGARTVIVGGRIADVVTRVVAGDEVGTLLLPDAGVIVARKQWIAGHLQMRGTLVIDEGAVRVLRGGGKSLLPVGVREVRGDFSRGEVVSCVDIEGREVARGLVNYGADEARRIAGARTAQIVERLGYADEAEMIHRDNLVVF